MEMKRRALRPSIIFKIFYFQLTHSGFTKRTKIAVLKLILLKRHLYIFIIFR